MRSTYLARLPLLLGLTLTQAACTSDLPAVAPASDDAGDTALSTDAVNDTARSDSSPTTDATTDGGAVDGDPVDIGPRDTGPSTDSGGASCGLPSEPTCSGGLNCCERACKNFNNDPLHCGECLHRCEGDTSMCLGGKCEVPTCAPACGPGQVCCSVPGPGPVGAPVCIVGITCPIGCPLCK
jgi:hypothetical protein